MHSVPLLIAAALLVPHGDADLRVRDRAPSGTVQLTSEQELLFDAADGDLDNLSLLEAALFAGGETSAADWRKLSAQFLSHCEGFRTHRSEQKSERVIAQEIFESLHAKLLVGRYQARCSDCAVALKHGDYNCVTATVLYIAALRKHGIKAEPYAMVGHVFCRVGDEQFDVETTCARWFRLSRNEANSAARRAAPGRAQARAAARMLSDVELIGKIYYNRGVACFKRGEFEQGMQLTQRSLTFDPQDEVARGNVLAGLNNWGLALCQRREFSQARQKFDRLRSIDPDYPTLTENEAHLERLWGENRLQHARAVDGQLDLPQG